MFRFVIINLLHYILVFPIRLSIGQYNETSKVCDCNCKCVVQIEAVNDDLVEDGKGEDKIDTKNFEIEKQFLPNRIYKPASCAEAAGNYLKSGIYKIQLENINITDFQVFCEEDVEFGGWTVIQRRRNGSVDFYRKWQDYTEGFGDLTGNYWIGLEKLHALTNRCEQELYIQMRTHNGTEYFAKYSEFLIGSESESYALKKLGNYSGNAGDSLTDHLGRKFSTYDRDNDDGSGNCAMYFKGAWWFGNCYDSHLNGVYGAAEDGVNWNSIKFEESLLFAQMMIRPTLTCFRRLLLSNLN